MTVRSLSFTFASCLLAALPAQHGGPSAKGSSSTQQSEDPKQPMYVAKSDSDARDKLRSVQLADGLTVDLIAAEPELCNAVAFAIDDRGNFYVAETFRVGDGVFDNRNFMHWLDDDLAARTVADRVAKYNKHLPAERIQALKSYSERIRMLADTDGNGTIDRTTVFAEGFTKLEDGLIAGVEPIDGEIWTTLIPKVWRLKDTNNDGIADERHAQFDGFGVHTSLMGHDLHGLIVGPDQRVYFSVGDRGFHVEHEGKTFAYPDEGAVLRCELDGSNLEVVHRGLRNPQELAFDRFGDLITGDNNSDGGDQARLVQILPGADSGWRIGYQWLSDRGAWNREKLWHPRHPEQTAQVSPPIRNFANGPSGLAYDPGIGLPERFRDCFFLCDFRGSSSYSGIRTFRLDRNGAGFEVQEDDKPIWNALATDVTFGPDGALYYLDWVHGWSKTGKARIYRVRTGKMANDLKLRNNARLLAADLSKRGKVQLQQLLRSPDRRVRQKAQFALVDQQAADALLAASNDRSSRMARLHGVWGLGTLLRRGQTDAAHLLARTKDSDADVRAMAARVLGDARHKPAQKALRKLLEDGNSRVRREAAFAFARLADLAANEANAKALLAMLHHNDDRDAVLRHAGVCALAAVASDDWLVQRSQDAGLASQRAILLALARRSSPAVARWLTHGDEQLRYEAARAIYETPIEAAMQSLALLIYNDEPDSERIDWRAINAARVLGTVEHGEALVHLATCKNHSAKTRREALDVLAEWPAPDGQCRVVGGWRPPSHPDAELVAQRFAGSVAELLADPDVATAAARATAGLGLVAQAQPLAQLVQHEAAATKARVAALNALVALNAPALDETLAAIPADAPSDLRKRAVELLSRSSPEKAVPVLESLLRNASMAERQAACKALADLGHDDATAVLQRYLARIDSDEVPAAIHLELFEATGENVEPFAGSYRSRLGLEAELAPFGMCLDGGDSRAGRKVFYEHQASSCTRCHTLQGRGGNAGPVLDGIGKRLKPHQILEALITPSKQIAEGFATTTIAMNNGDYHAGVVTSEDKSNVTIVGADGKPTNVTVADIAKRLTSKESAMPAMDKRLTRRQLRDLIAFLRRQK
ncbi:MAG: HEAT repeat domain-containing protein [Planctomycetota bacterium]